MLGMEAVAEQMDLKHKETGVSQQDRLAPAVDPNYSNTIHGSLSRLGTPVALKNSRSAISPPHQLDQNCGPRSRMAFFYGSGSNTQKRLYL
jgi:hypothetical protein